MKKYRVVESIYNSGDRSYVMQKKSIFGFWYNPDNVDANITGVYNTFKEALDAIDRKLSKVIKKVIYTTGCKEY